jgi:hypothetical protein
MGSPDPAFFTLEFDLEAALDASSDGAAGQYILPRLHSDVMVLCGFESWLCWTPLNQVYVMFIGTLCIMLSGFESWLSVVRR